MMDEFIHWPKTLPFSYHQLCDDTLSWMIEIWMKKITMVSDGDCNNGTL
jgi:hypothetical protein